MDLTLCLFQRPIGGPRRRAVYPQQMQIARRWRGMPDSELRIHVEEALDWEPSVVSTHIGVSCEDGVVTLSGHVGSWAEKWDAESAAKRVRGVRGLANEIDVELPEHHHYSDTDLARAAVQALEWRCNIPE